MADAAIAKDRRGGTLCTTHNGHLMVWNGHLCEGAQMVPFDPGTFILWTRCGRHDVPANAAWEGSAADVTCPGCAAALSPRPADEGAA